MKNWPPKISIIMGSDSDLPIMKKTCDVCNDFGVGYEMRVISAHRNPLEIMDYAQNVQKRGIKVIIAGAGGAAHLPGVIAGNTPLPVIGVPINTKINGLDSLLSIVQMPPGVPVASMAIDGAKNAGLYAMQILATGDEAMMQKYIEYKKKASEESAAKNNNPEFTELYKP
ncbi:MAG: 5-(carboxyamino)imidazole ribonucleotide mutase [bacterium]